MHFASYIFARENTKCNIIHVGQTMYPNSFWHHGWKPILHFAFLSAGADFYALGLGSDPTQFLIAIRELE